MEHTENTNPVSSFQSRIDMTELRDALDRIKSEISKVIVGQESMVEHLLTALLSNGPLPQNSSQRPLMSVLAGYNSLPI